VCKQAEGVPLAPRYPRDAHVDVAAATPEAGRVLKGQLDRLLHTTEQRRLDKVSVEHGADGPVREVESQGDAGDEGDVLLRRVEAEGEPPQHRQVVEAFAELPAEPCPQRRELHRPADEWRHEAGEHAAEAACAAPHHVEPPLQAPPEQVDKGVQQRRVADGGAGEGVDGMEVVKGDVH